jgi:hypothetical protein
VVVVSAAASVAVAVLVEAADSGAEAVEVEEVPVVVGLDCDPFAANSEAGLALGKADSAMRWRVVLVATAVSAVVEHGCTFAATEAAAVVMVAKHSSVCAVEVVVMAVRHYCRRSRSSRSPHQRLWMVVVVDMVSVAEGIADWIPDAGAVVMSVGRMYWAVAVKDSGMVVMVAALAGIGQVQRMTVVVPALACRIVGEAAEVWSGSHRRSVIAAVRMRLIVLNYLCSSSRQRGHMALQTGSLGRGWTVVAVLMQAGHT